MTEQEKEIQELRRELEEKDRLINTLQELHYLDLSEIDYQRRQIDFLMESAQVIPAADVRPVVFCKDCVYSDKWYKDRLICYLWNEHDGNSVFEDGFCNYGSKREES